MTSCSHCTSPIDAERFDLLYEGKGVKFPVCQACASKGVSQPSTLRGVVHCSESGEHEGLTFLTQDQWNIHRATFGSMKTSIKDVQEEIALEGLALE